VSLLNYAWLDFLVDLWLIVLFATFLAVGVFVVVRIVKRRDLGVGGKVLWIIALVMFPPATVLTYVIWAVIRRRRDPLAAW